MMTSVEGFGREEQNTNDFEYVRKRLLTDAESIELPPALRSDQLLSLLEEPQESQEPQKPQKPESVQLPHKRTVYLQFVAYAACLALAFFGFYKMVQYTADSAVRLDAPATPIQTAGADGEATPQAAQFRNAEIERAVPAAEQPVAKTYDEVAVAIETIQAKRKGPNLATGGAPSLVNPSTAGGNDAAPSPEMSAANSSGRKSVYQTNAQVDGVDEADIIKTDGTYIYQYRLNHQTGGAQIAIVGASNLKELSSIELGEYADAEMYVQKDRLAVVQRTTEERAQELLRRALMPQASESVASTPSETAEVIVPDFYRPPQESARPAVMTEVCVYDISDRQNPKEIGRHTQDGRYVSSRMYQNMIYLVTNKSLGYSPFPQNALPSEYIPIVGAEDTASLLSPGDIIIPPYLENADYAIISAIDLVTDQRTTKAVLGMADEIMMNTQSLYVTARVRDPQTWEVGTGLSRFMVDGTDVSYVASAYVPGEINNQFSLDEFNGDLRIATTSRNRDGKSVNNLYVLDPRMQARGSVENLAEGERIESVRFIQDVAYVVTFRQTDPLFVIDLSNPAVPVVKGQLKIPGFSEYLHPIDANTLVGLGRNTTVDSRGNVVEDGLKLSLFNVSDPGNPLETASLLLGNSGSKSEALSDHHAVMYHPELRLLGFPATICTGSADPWSGERNVTFSGYLVVRVKTDGFEVVGEISNDASETGYHRADPNGMIERGIYIGKTLYTAAPNRLTAYSIDNFVKIGELVYEP